MNNGINDIENVDERLNLLPKPKESQVKKIDINESPYHIGKASVNRFVEKKR